MPSSNKFKLVLFFAALVLMGEACSCGRVLTTVRHTVSVISYNGGYIPVAQLHVGTGPDCEGGNVPHWHVREAGSLVDIIDKAAETDADAPTRDIGDPNPNGCGFCKVTDCPIKTVNVYYEAPTTVSTTP